MNNTGPCVDDNWVQTLELASRATGPAQPRDGAAATPTSPQPTETTPTAKDRTHHCTARCGDRYRHDQSSSAQTRETSYPAAHNAVWPARRTVDAHNRRVGTQRGSNELDGDTLPPISRIATSGCLRWLGMDFIRDRRFDPVGVLSVQQRALRHRDDTALHRRKTH